MSFEETPIREDGTLTHVNDFVEVDRLEARRRLDFISAKLASSALQDIVLGYGLDDELVQNDDMSGLAQSDFSLAA